MIRRLQSPIPRRAAWEPALPVAAPLWLVLLLVVGIPALSPAATAADEGTPAQQSAPLKLVIKPSSGKPKPLKAPSKAKPRAPAAKPVHSRQPVSHKAAPASRKAVGPVARTATTAKPPAAGPKPAGPGTKPPTAAGKPEAVPVEAAAPSRAAAPQAKAAPAPKAGTAPRGPSLVLKPARLEIGPGEKGFLVEATVRPAGRKAAAARVTVEAPAGISVTPAEWQGSVPGWGAKVYFRVGADAAARGPAPIRFRADFDGTGIDASSALAAEVVPPVQIALRPDPAGSNVRVWVRNLLKHRPLKARVAVSNKERFLKDIISRMTPEIPPGGSAEVAIPVMPEGIAPDVPYRFDAAVQTFQGYQGQAWRNLTYLYAPRVAAPPDLQGSLRGWQDSYVVVARGAAARRITGVTARTVWDDRYLYVQARVTAPPPAPTSDPLGRPGSDNLQIALDPTGLHLPGSTYLLLTVTGRSSGGPLDVVAQRGGQASSRRLLEGVRSFMGWTEGQGTYVLALPWRELGLTPRIGLQFGFSVRANAGDGATPTEGLGYGGGLGPVIDPSQFGDLSLTGAGSP